MGKKQVQIADNSPLTKLGFQEFPEWNFALSKGRVRRVYLKRLGADVIKAYQHERGFVFGLLLEPDKPLCKAHFNADTIDEVKQKIQSWTAKM